MTKRRTKEQTRRMLLDSALRVLLAQSSAAAPAGASNANGAPNPFAGVRITDALEDVNRRLREADPSSSPMTTGAAYNIWPTQEEFQLALLDRILTDAATPQIGMVRAELEAGIAGNASWDELVTRCFGVDFEVSFVEPTMFVMIGLTAFGPVSRLVELDRHPNAHYVKDTAEILQRILRHGRRRLRRGRTMEDLVWAIEAVEVGYLLRRRTHPQVTERTVKGRTVVQEAILAVVERFTEPSDR